VSSPPSGGDGGALTAALLIALAVHGFTVRDRLPLAFSFEARTARHAIQLATALRAIHRDASVRVRPRPLALASGARWSVSLRTGPIVLCYSTVRRMELQLHEIARRCAGTRLRGWRPVLAPAEAERVLQGVPGAR
jgi:hypothetical protein